MSDVDSFLTSLKAAYRDGNDEELAALLDPLDLHTRAQLSESLKVALPLYEARYLNEATDRLVSPCCCIQAAPHLRPSSYTSLAKTFFPDNGQFADFVASFLLFVRDSELEISEDQPAAAINTFELFSSCYG